MQLFSFYDLYVCKGKKNIHTLWLFFCFFSNRFPSKHHRSNRKDPASPIFHAYVRFHLCLCSSAFMPMNQNVHAYEFLRIKKVRKKRLKKVRPKYCKFKNNAYLCTAFEKQTLQKAIEKTPL